jgi:hypothetical protein
VNIDGFQVSRVILIVCAEFMRFYYYFFISLLGPAFCDVYRDETFSLKF